MSDLIGKLKERRTYVQSSVMSMRRDVSIKRQTEEELNSIKVLITKMKSSLETYKKSRLTVNKIHVDKRRRDDENIDMAMQLATNLVEKGNGETPFFVYPDGAVPEASLCIQVGEYALPLKLIEGTGFNEGTALTTLTAVMSATDFMKFFFLDEFFASVSAYNTVNISSNLNEMFDGRFQIVIVEQKDEVVEHTNHREFLIVYNEETEESHIETYDVFADGTRRKVE